MNQRIGNKKNNVKEFTSKYQEQNIIDIGEQDKSVDYPILFKVYRKRSQFVKHSTDFSLLNDCQYSGSGWSKNTGVFFNKEGSTCYSKRCQGVYCCENYWLSNNRCLSVLPNTAVRDKICSDGHGPLIRSNKRQRCLVMIYLVVTPENDQYLFTLGQEHNHPNPPPSRTPQFAKEVITNTVDTNPRITVDQLVLGEAMNDIPSNIHISLQNRSKLSGIVRHRFKELYGPNNMEIVKKIERSESSRMKDSTRSFNDTNEFLWCYPYIQRYTDDQTKQFILCQSPLMSAIAITNKGMV